MNNFSGNLKAAAFQFMQTLYDTGVFSLICYKAVNSAINGPKNGGSILNIIAKHGVTYYAYVDCNTFRPSMILIHLKCTLLGESDLGPDDIPSSCELHWCYIHSTLVCSSVYIGRSQIFSCLVSAFRICIFPSSDVLKRTNTKSHLSVRICSMRFSITEDYFRLATTMVSRITLSLRSHTSKMDPHFNTEIGLDAWKVPTIGSSGYLTSALPTMTITDTSERTYGTAHTESVLDYYSEYHASNSHSYELSNQSTEKDQYYDHSFYRWILAWRVSLFYWLSAIIAPLCNNWMILIGCSIICSIRKNWKDVQWILYIPYCTIIFFRLYNMSILFWEASFSSGLSITSTAAFLSRLFSSIRSAQLDAGTLCSPSADFAGQISSSASCSWAWNSSISFCRLLAPARCSSVNCKRCGISWATSSKTDISFSSVISRIIVSTLKSIKLFHKFLDRSQKVLFLIDGTFPPGPHFAFHFSFWTRRASTSRHAWESGHTWIENS